MLNTPEKINAFRLASLKQALKLEILGFKINSKINANKMVCNMLGLPVRTKREKTLELLEAYIANN